MDTRRGVRGLGRSIPRTTLIWVAAVVVVLVVLDVVLVSLALGRTAPEQNGPAGPIPTYSSTPRSPSSATPGASGTPTAPAEAGAADGVSARHLLVRDQRQGGVASLQWVVFRWAAGAGALRGRRGDVGGGRARRRRARRDGAARHDRAAGGAGHGRRRLLAAVRTSVDAGPPGAPVSPAQPAPGSATPPSCCRPARSSRPVPNRSTRTRGSTRRSSRASARSRGGAGPARGSRCRCRASGPSPTPGSTYTLARTRVLDVRRGADREPAATRVTAGSQVSPIGCWQDGGSEGPVAVDLAGTTLWAWAGDTRRGVGGRWQDVVTVYRDAIASRDGHTGLEPTYSRGVVVTDALALIWVAFGVQIAWLGLDSRVVDGSIADLRRRATPRVSVVHHRRLAERSGPLRHPWRPRTSAPARGVPAHGRLGVRVFVCWRSSRSAARSTWPAATSSSRSPSASLCCCCHAVDVAAVARCPAQHGAVLGDGAARRLTGSVQHIARELIRHPEEGYRVVGACVPTGDVGSVLGATGVPVLGRISDAVVALREHRRRHGRRDELRRPGRPGASASSAGNSRAAAST